MAWQDAIINLASVALGGVIAAAAGSRSARRANTASALQALTEMRELRFATGEEAGVPDSDLMLRARAALLVAGAPWVLVEMHERATRAVLLATWHIGLSRDQAAPERERRYAQAVFHPARFSSRPTMQLADSLEQAIAETLERPFVSMVVGPWRQIQLRSAVKQTAKENEVTRFPPSESDAANHVWQLVVVGHTKQWLTWPRRRALSRGLERTEVGSSWYPDSARTEGETSS